MKKLPIALSLLAVATFALGACDDNDDEPAPVEIPTMTSMSPVPEVSVSPSECVSASASPSVSVSVSASPTDEAKNDVPGDGGVAFRGPLERKAGISNLRPNQPEPSESATSLPPLDC